MSVLTNAVGAPVTWTAALYFHLLVALEGAATEGQLHAGSVDVVPAEQTDRLEVKWLLMLGSRTARLSPLRGGGG